MSLRDKAVGGIAWNGIGSISIALIQFLQLSLLSGLLSKSDFGLMAIVAALAVFARGWLDLGWSNAIIHHQGLSRIQLATFLWLGTAVGTLVCLMAMAGGGVLAAYYQEPELAGLVVPVALTFIAFPAGNQFQLLLQKELRFREITLAEVGSKIAGLAITLTLAWYGQNAWALAWGFAASEILRCLLFIVIGYREHFPGFAFHFASVREFTSFGLYQLGARAMSSLVYEMDVLIIGKVLGKEALGLYSYAKQMVAAPAQMLIPIITRVSFPALAKVQSDDERVRKIFIRSLRALTLVIFPVYAVLVVAADEVVLVFFGRDWGPTLLVMQVLAIMAALRSVLSPVGALVLSKGRARRLFFWNLSQFILLPVAMVSFAPFGLVGISWAGVAVYALLFMPSWLFLVYPLSGVKLSEYLKIFIAPVSLSAAVVFAGLAVQELAQAHLIRLLLIAFTSGLLIAATNLWLNRDILLFLRSKIITTKR